MGAEMYVGANVADLFAPAATSREFAVIKNHYDAAGHGRRMAGWNPSSTGPNSAISTTSKLLDRAQDSIRNDWSASALVQKWVTTLVGVGITPRFPRVTDPERRRYLNDLMSDFSRQCDADGVSNLSGLQSLSTGGYIGDGESFIVRRKRSIKPNRRLPLQIQIVESQMVPRVDFDSHARMPKGNRVRSGIELSNSNERMAIWMYRLHPNDKDAQTVDESQLIRVPIADVHHMFSPSRAGALRGVSVLAPMLAPLRNVGDYTDAVLERQKLANLYVAFITKKSREEFLPESEQDGTEESLAGVPMGKDAEGQALAGMSPGITQELDEGEGVAFSNPPEAGTTYSDYLRTSYLGVAAGGGMPYELLSGDILNISDRTLRVVMNEFRRLAEQRQWQVIIPAWEKVMSWVAEAAMLADQIRPKEFEAVKRASFSTHGWAHIHPVQDPQGKKLEVDAGFRSRSSVVGGMGDDVFETDEERSQDAEREKTLGILSVVAPTGKVSSSGVVVPKEGDAKPDLKDLKASMEQLIFAMQTLTEGGE